MRDLTQKCSNQCPGFLPERFTNASSRASTHETRAGKFMKQILFWLIMSKLKWFTSMLCSIFPFQRRLKAGHAAHLIHSRQNHIQLQALECEVKSTDQTFLCFFEWLRHTEALFQAFYRGWSPSEDEWRNTLWLSSQKSVYCLQRPLQSQLAAQINADKEPVGAVAGIMEKQVVDAFNEPIHHRQC